MEPRQELRAAPEICIGIQNDKQDEWVELTGRRRDRRHAGADRRRGEKHGHLRHGRRDVPDHIKLSIPKAKRADTVILNGAECEPYLTADHSSDAGVAARIIDGLRLNMRATGVKRGVIAVEKNKPDAIKSLRRP